MGVGLLLLYGGLFQESLDPILAASSFGVLASALLMAYLVIKFPRPESASHEIQAQPRVPADVARPAGSLRG